MTALFSRLLGGDFARLAPAVRSVHCGRSLVLHGRTDVARGGSFVARLLCAFGRLPRTQADAPTRVEIAVHGEREVWRRHFGASPAMRSVFSGRDGVLRERFGPAVLEFALAVEAGAVSWRPVRASLFAIPIPRRWLSDIEARAFERDRRYYFQVRVALAGIGTVIQYFGHLDPDREAA